MHTDRRISRWPQRLRRFSLKSLLFVIVVTFVLFPDPRLLVRDIRHATHLESMVDPNAPDMVEFEESFRQWLQRQRASARSASLPASAPARRRPPSDMLAAVESFVYEQVQYEWDWELWGSADYIPTVSEIFEKARQSNQGRLREDCDGRAVMAASLLRRLGYPSELVTDFAHVWVETCQMLPATRPGEKPRPGKKVELMGPGVTRAIVSSGQGNQVNWEGLANVPRALAYGISVFPWVREAIILGTLLLLLADWRAARAANAVGVLLALAGLQLLRANGHDYRAGDMWNAWLGLAYAAGGCGVLVWAAWVRRRRAAGVAPTSDTPGS